MLITLIYLISNNIYGTWKYIEKMFYAAITVTLNYIVEKKCFPSLFKSIFILSTVNYLFKDAKKVYKTL